MPVEVIPIKACLEVTANNCGFDLAGNFQPDATINVPSWCTYDSSGDQDEETLAEELGIEDFTTHEEAIARGQQNNNSDWHKNRVKERDEINAEKTTKTLLIAGAIALATGVL